MTLEGDFEEAEMALNLTATLSQLSSEGIITTTPSGPSFTIPEGHIWCIDIEMYYSSMNNKFAPRVLRLLEKYNTFGFFVNGLITMLLVVFGLVGNFLLVCQIRGQRFFSRRLAVHLGMLCVWDILMLISCALSYGVVFLLYGRPSLYGIMAYVQIFMQPFASFCVSATIWQVLAITVERYLAVSQPLEQRTRKARFSARWICVAIALLAFMLNMVPVPFERQLVNCFEFTNGGVKTHKMIVTKDVANTPLYGILVHLVPDLIFRAPTPILFMAVLTVRTIQRCTGQRTVGSISINIQTRRNIPMMLSLLSLKFIVCNILYLFNTILIEVLGFGRQDGEISELVNGEFIYSMYLTDLSNLLLVIHSSTNWLLFYHFYKCSAKASAHDYQQNSSFSTSSRVVNIDPHCASVALRRFAHIKHIVGAEIVAKLCEECSNFATVLFDQSPPYIFYEQFLHHKAVQKHGQAVGDFIEQILRWFTTSSPQNEARALCRKIGRAHFSAGVHFSVNNWKLIRRHVVKAITDQHAKHTHRSCKEKEMSVEALEETVTRIFNFVLCEMRSGALCASVDANQRTNRSMSTCSGPLGRELSLLAARSHSTVQWARTEDFPVILELSPN